MTTKTSQSFDDDQDNCASFPVGILLETFLLKMTMPDVSEGRDNIVGDSKNLCQPQMGFLAGRPETKRMTKPSAG